MVVTLPQFMSMPTITVSPTLHANNMSLTTCKLLLTQLMFAEIAPGHHPLLVTLVSKAAGPFPTASITSVNITQLWELTR